MIYAISDLHGCYDKYIEMLDKIKFKADDLRYILGDVLDRGNGGIKILLDIARRDNVILLKGNHEDIAFRVLRYLLDRNVIFDEDRFVGLLQVWKEDGGAITINQFLEFTEDEQRTVLQTIYYSDVYKKLEVRNRTFWLSHTVPEVLKKKNLETCDMKGFLWGEPEYDKKCFEDKILVTGHTPTGFINQDFKGRILKKNNHIAIDCGAVFGQPLGCICLDTLEEFYV